MRFCADTSVLIESWQWRYPPDLAPDLWAGLSRDVEAGIVLIPDEVLIELERKEDRLHAWLAERERLLIPPTPEIQRSLTNILTRYRKILDTRSNKNRADPIVVATAIVHRATVITEEKHAPGPDDRPNIATLCDGFGVPHISILGYMRERKWKLSVSFD